MVYVSLHTKRTLIGRGFRELQGCRYAEKVDVTCFPGTRFYTFCKWNTGIAFRKTMGYTETTNTRLG